MAGRMRGKKTMVKILQRKFMAASMLAVTLLLLVLVGMINILNAVSVVRRQESILNTLCETDLQPDLPRQGGGFAGRGREAGADLPEGAMPDFGETGGRGDEQFPGDLPGGKGGRLSVDNVLSARFFAVWIAADQTVEKTDTSRIYAVDDESAEQFAQEILALGKTRGTRKGFRYMIRDRVGEEQGQLLVAMDISSDRQGLLTVLGISALIAAVCWTAMLWPVYLLAKRAIAPTAMSISRQKQFVTNAGHELKTPLAIIQTNLDALELHNGPSKWTGNIRTQTVRLNGLMQNLLTLSRMDESGLQLRKEFFALDRLAEAVWKDFAASAEARSLHVQFDFPGADGPAEEPGGGDPEEAGGSRVFGNRDSIAQLLSILFDNAVKYTPRRGEITVRIRTDAGGAELIQSNPVAPGEKDPARREDPERLFERFYRPDEDRSRKKGGYGIGLSAARAIAEANQGTIHAAYEQDRIVFTLRLPIK